MTKSILNLGKTLNKVEQKSINGGYSRCTTDSDCQLGYKCYVYAQNTCQDPDYPTQY